MNKINHTMEIIEVNYPKNRNDFSVKKFIKAGDKHYAEIQPHQKSYRIMISSSDYYKAIRAYYSAESIECYPIDGILVNDTFEEVHYELVIK